MPSLISKGLFGAKIEADMATRTNSVMIAIPATAALFRINRAQASAHRLREGRLSANTSALT